MYIRPHEQSDAIHFGPSIAGSSVLTSMPNVVIPMYIKFISPDIGFGLFAGADLPDSSLAVDQCVGSYGGIVCDEREPIHHKAVFKMRKGTLPPDKKDGLYVLSSILHLSYSQGAKAICGWCQHACWGWRVCELQLSSKHRTRSHILHTRPSFGTRYVG